jgi:hypothetical protein
MSFKVAILSAPVALESTSFWESMSYGIQVYNLSADQICSLLQGPDHSNGKTNTVGLVQKDNKSSVQVLMLQRWVQCQ